MASGKSDEGFAPLNSGGRSSFSRINRLLSAVAIVSGFVMLCVVGFQSWEGLRGHAGQLEILKVCNLLLVGAAGFACGAFAGFIFGAIGEEKQSFSGLTSVLNGVIGGFALSDLSKGDSLIRRGLLALAFACGLKGVGLVACVLAVFGCLGFMLMYMNKQYLLNPALSKAQQLATQNQSLMLLTRSVKVSLAEIGGLPKASDKVLDAIKGAVKEFETASHKDPDLVALLSVEALKAYSKAFYVTGDTTRAEALLRQARTQGPDDPETLFYLSHILITAQRPLEAIPYLEYLQALPNVMSLTWKLLGYACLFDPNRLGEAEVATRKFLELYPNDAGAHLNLACVFGQRGPGDPANVAAVKTHLGAAIRLEPETKKLVQDTLTQPGQDFAVWSGTADFTDLLK